jgi:hypothetical protein
MFTKMHNFTNGDEDNDDPPLEKNIANSKLPSML